MESNSLAEMLAESRRVGLVGGAICHKAQGAEKKKEEVHELSSGVWG